MHIRSVAQLREYERIVDRIARDAPGHVLDWGAGYGQIVHMLRERGVQASAADYGPTSVPPEERYADVEITLADDPVSLPWPDSTFDAVLSLGVLEHVQFPERSLDEVRRILRPGGTFYCYKLPNRWSYLEWIAKHAGLYYHGAYDHDRLYTRRSARELVEAHGFRITELRHANVLPLSVPGRVGDRIGPALWALNRLLSPVPGIRSIATNVELVAVTAAP